ncbi:histone deacetylase complex subunit SAP130 [Culicoides brevitarsis]|uniref:histone deacetylase complex subunit SAP130 n=1 Tax=Culicoides brevitarsis TaxID=469753 RepID=UPI00307CA883
MQDGGGDKNLNKFDLTTKVALTKDNKGGTTATLHPQFRTMQPMRVVTIPSSSTGGAQIIQTQLVPQVQTMIKQVDNRITVSRPVTPTSYLPRGPTTVTNIQAPRGSTPIRGSTPPSTVTNITQSFVRTTGSPRAPNSSATATLIPQGTTWMSSSGVQVQVPTQLIRANITQSPRPRVVTQAIPQNSSSNNSLTQQTSIQQSNQTVHGANVITAGNNQAFVATLALPPRQQGASLVYSQVSSTQPNQTFGQGQRLAVATSIGTQRQVRPLQRLPTSNLGMRVSTANLSIRQSVPVLATIPSAASTRTTTGTVTTNLAQIPARIIQPGGTAQVINARGVPANVMTLQPIIRFPNVKTQIPQQLTIAHVSKIATAAPATGSLGTSTSNSPATITVTNLQQGGNQGQGGNMSQNQQLTASIVQGAVLNSQGQLQTQKSPQIAHILSVNPQQQQHQIITSVQQQQQNSSQNSTITSCGKTIPLVTVSVANLPGNVIRGISTMSNRETPVAKVLPRQQIENSGQQNNQSGTSVFIHTTPPNLSGGQQISSQPSGTVASGLPSGTFISPATKFIYEHIPSTSSVSISSSTIIDSIFSLPKTTVSKATSTVVSTMNPIMTSQTSSSSSSGATESTSSSGGTVISSSISYTPQPGSFAVVPTSNRTTVGQIHVSTSNMSQGQGQIQTVPVRFNPQLLVDSSGNQTHSTQIIAVPNTIASSHVSNSNNNSQSTIQTISQLNNQSQGQIIQGLSSQSIMIPASVSKVESPRPNVSSSSSSILRKRDSEGSPIRHSGKNLTAIPVSASSAGSMSTQSAQQMAKQQQQQVQQIQQQLQHLSSQQQDDRPMSPHSRPPSTDGSTTVSATSSPNIDQQEQEEMANLMYGNHMNDLFGGPSGRSSMHSGVPHQNSTESSSNGQIDPSPRKKPRKSNENINTSNMYMMQNSNNKLINNNAIKQSNEMTVKKPQSVSLLQCYKQTWKAANNHFQRYSDVRPRDERRPSVMDLANQAHVLQKVNGWKIYHLSSQVEELCELESQVYDKLASQLESMEAHNSSPDVDRVSELLKGNMQREKIIIDGINDARTQLMKVFDHKSPVADIIHRCASKRNFKKREKP